MAAKVKIDPSLYERLTIAGRAAGYASTEEFIMHVLEQAVAGLDEAAADDEVEKQLRGLGYIE